MVYGRNSPMNKKLLKVLLPPILLLIAAVPLAYAGVVVAYPITGNVGYTAPDIKLQPGSNAGQPGLGGNTIAVTVGPNFTSAQFNITITYSITEYHDILVINNTNPTQAFYIGFNAVTNLPAQVSNATMVITDDAGNIIATYDLLAGGWSGWLFQIPNATTYHINLIFKMAEGQPLPLTPGTITLYLYWSNSNTETPMTTP